MEVFHLSLSLNLQVLNNFKVQLFSFAYHFFEANILLSAKVADLKLNICTGVIQNRIKNDRGNSIGQLLCKVKSDWLMFFEEVLYFNVTGERQIVLSVF